MVIEREVPSHENEEDDTTRPNVDLGSVVATASEHLRRDIRRGAAEGVEEPVLPDLIRYRAETKVGDLEIAIGVIYEEVLRFEITVEDTTGVAEGNGGDQLLEVPAGGVLMKTTFSHTGEKLTAADELHNEVDFGSGGHDLEEMDNIGVASTSEGGDLALGVGDETAL